MDWGWDNLRAVLGIAIIFGLVWLMSENRKKFPWKIVLGAVAMQFAFALILYGIPVVNQILFKANLVVDALIEATAAGTGFVFGPVFGTQDGWSGFTQSGPIFAVHLLPLIIVVAALSAILWHWRILRWVTQGFAAVFRKILGLSGATSLSVAANVFMGMTEAPILVKPYIKTMSRSEIFVLMTAGFATVAGSVIVLYSVILSPVIEQPLAQLVTASMMAAPAAVALALVMVPETSDGVGAFKSPDFGYASTMDAFATGASDGLKIVGNIVTMLIAALAILFLVNAGLSTFPDVGGETLSLQRILGWLFAPIMYLAGVPWDEAMTSGSLLGIKTVLTEFVAFSDLAATPDSEISARTRLITAHAICGFANFGSVGILIGGLSIIEPEKRDVFLSLAWKTLIAGSLATCLSGAVVGALPVSLFLGG